MYHLLFLNVGAPGLIFAVLIFAVLPLYCLFDILKSNFKDTLTKLLWLLVVFSVPFIGSLLYLRVGKNSKVDVIN